MLNSKILSSDYIWQIQIVGSGRTTGTNDVTTSQKWWNRRCKRGANSCGKLL